MAEMRPMPETLDAVTAAERVTDLFSRLHATLDDWREAILAGADGAPTALDDRVAALVLPVLGADDPLLVGAGFIAAPGFTGGDGLHFAWWLGPLDENPVFGATTGPTRLDLSARSYAEYLRDFDALDWYRIPSTTHRTHITGPYVDHLCACDYIVTVTSPVERDGRMLGVVGLDVAVKRLERELLPALLAASEPLAVVNAAGRVMVSTDPGVVVGSVLDGSPGGVACPGTPFRVEPTRAGR